MSHVEGKRTVESYFQTFLASDVSAVADVASYITRTHQNIAAVLLRFMLDTNRQKGIVYVMEHTRQGEVLTEVNWAAPGAPPQAYDRYARDFYDFIGPADIQENRSALLAEVLQVLLLTGDEKPSGLSIPSLGVIMRDNPLRDNPFRARVNFGSHVREE